MLPCPGLLGRWRAGLGGPTGNAGQDSAKDVQESVAAESPGVPAEQLRILMPTSKSLAQREE